MLELIQTIGLGLVMLLPLANPLTAMVLFIGLSRRMTAQQRRSQITQTTLYVFLIMTVAYYGGQFILHSFGISIPGLRIAGGLIVGLVGLNMLFSPEDSNSDAEAAEKAEELLHETRAGNVNIAFVPLAMPGTAGPGTIAMLVSAAAEVESRTDITLWVALIAPTLIFLLVSLLLWLCLRSSGVIMRYLGTSGIAAISRLMGFLLVCIGTQFIINGVLDITASFQAIGGGGA